MNYGRKAFRFAVICCVLGVIVAGAIEAAVNFDPLTGRLQSSFWKLVNGVLSPSSTSWTLSASNVQVADNASMTLNRVDRHSSAFIAYATAAAYDMTATDMQGRIIRTTVQQAINVYNCEKGDNFWVLNRSGGTISLQPSETGTADRFWYNGTDTGAAGDEIDVSDGTTAECISTSNDVLECFCFPTTGCTDGGAT